MSHTVDDYREMLLGLLPRGLLWKDARSGLIGNLFSALSAELARIEGDAERALRELDPAQATESLEDWEYELGIPDECGLVGENISSRRNAVRNKLQRGHLMNAAYYTELAHVIGFDGAAATDIVPLRADYGRAEAGVYEDGQTAVNTFILTIPGTSSFDEKRFRPGASRSGDKLRTWEVSQLQCIINRDKPAHTICIFSYE